MLLLQLLCEFSSTSCKDFHNKNCLIPPTEHILAWYKISSNPVTNKFYIVTKKCMKSCNIFLRYTMRSMNSSGLIQIALKCFSAAPTSSVICVYFMLEIVERCIDLCFVLNTVINFVIEQGMGGKNVSRV